MLFLKTYLFHQFFLSIIYSNFCIETILDQQFYIIINTNNITEDKWLIEKLRWMIEKDKNEMNKEKIRNVVSIEECIIY